MALTALQRRDALLERGAGGVRGAAVLVAAAQATDAVLLVGAHLVDRGYHRSGRGVRVLPGKDGARGEAEVLEGHGAQRMPGLPTSFRDLTSRMPCLGSG